MLSAIYTIILLKSVCLSLYVNYRPQFLLDRLGRYLKMFVSTVIPSFLRVRISVRPSNVFMGEKHPKLSQKLSHRTSIRLIASARRNADNLNGDNCGHGWSPVTHRNGDNLNGDNCGHSGNRLSQNGRKSTSKNSDNKSWRLEKIVLGIIT